MTIDELIAELTKVKAVVGGGAVVGYCPDHIGEYAGEITKIYTSSPDKDGGPAQNYTVGGTPIAILWGYNNLELDSPRSDETDPDVIAKNL